ncbi:MAG: hypothetical protein AB1440_05560 [Pseudomonadota bacterium]|jgi:hypothetical protein
MTDVATIRTSPKDELRITAIVDSKGRRTINIRSWFLAADGSYRPSKDGLQIKTGVVKEVVTALLRLAP